jgi:hypothetical protein
MAQKHKSKYKAPKDLEKSRKLTARKDLKDYTLDDKKGGLNPKSTGEKQLNVLRKTDKETVDSGKLDIKYDADDRLYKKLEDGDYDPKTASKRIKKRLDQEEKDSKDQIKDKIENLTREQKEYLVRQYIRTKIQRIISEQTADPNKPADDAAAPPPADAAATPPATDTATPPADAAAATPPADAGAAPTGGAPAGGATPPAGGATPPASSTPPAAPTEKQPEGEKDAEKDSESEEEKLDPEAKQALDTDRFIKSIKKMTGTVEKVKAIAKVVKDATDDLEYDDSKNFYQMLRTYAINKLERLGSSDKKSKK